MTEGPGPGDRDASAPRYDFDGIDLDSGSVHADVVHLVGDASHVLELGPATGYMSRVLSERGSTVVGIELDPAMAERASEFCRRIVLGDLDTLDLDAELGDERFDAIVAADVIEHLKDPLGVLKRLRPFLAKDGHFVISVPNVAHGSVRLALLSGHFDYRPRGLLDSTHLRFFTRETFQQLLDEAELGVIDLHRHEVDFELSEVDFDDEVVPPEVHAELECDPDARTYQFVVKAAAMDGEGMRELQARQREVAELRSRVGELERELDEATAREDEHRKVLSLQGTAIAQWEERHAADTDVLCEEVENLRSEITRLQLRLDRILAGRLARVYAALCRLPGLGAIRRRRQTGFAAELERREHDG